MIDSERLYTVATNEVLAPFGKTFSWEVRPWSLGNWSFTDHAKEFLRCNPAAQIATHGSTRA